jgi:hypothetical protein
MADSTINVVQSRSVKTSTRANFLPVVTHQVPGAPHSNQYLDYLSAGYLTTLAQITEYTMMTVDQSIAYRPDFISFKAYGTTDHWWLVCFFNKIIHPMRDLYPSRVLKIPSPSQVTKMFQRMQTKTTNIGKIVTI